MNKMVKSVFIALAMLVLSASATAQDFRPYVGSGLGGFIISNGSGPSWVLGGYGSIGIDINDYIAAEFRGGKTATGSNNSGKFGIDWFFSYLLKPQIKLKDYKVNFYGLLGASTIKSWSNASRKTVTAFSFGAGIEAYATDNIILGIEGMLIDSKDKTRAAGEPYNGNQIGSAIATVRMLF